MSYCNPIRIGFGWAQDVRVDGALPGDRFRATFSPSLGGPSIVLPDVEPLAGGRICLRMDGSVTAGFAEGAYAWEMLLIRGQASAVIAGLPPVEAAVPATLPVPESNPLAGPLGLPLRVSLSGEQPQGIVLSLRADLAGPPGPPGPAGAPSVFVQAAPAATWTVPHNLGRFPMVAVYSTGGQKVLAGLLNLSPNVCLIEFDEPMAGTATLI